MKSLATKLFRVFVFSWLIIAACAASAAAQQTHLLVVTGVPGDDDHAQKFQKWATSFIDAAKKKDAVPDANITYLSDRKATRDGIDAAFTALASRAKPSDTTIVLLIGHGSFDGRAGAFNIMGPDLTDVEAMLAKSDAVQSPLRPSVPGPVNLPPIDTFKPMTLDYGKAAVRVEDVTKRLQTILGL